MESNNAGDQVTWHDSSPNSGSFENARALGASALINDVETPSGRFEFRKSPKSAA